MTSLQRVGAVVSVATVVCVAAAGCGNVASGVSVLRPQASVSAKSGTIRLFATMKRSGKATVVVTGVIGDFGRSFPADKNGKANSNDNYMEVVVKRGTFVLDERALNSNKAVDRPRSNNATCSTWLTGTAKVPVSEGTGAYAGVHGSIDATLKVAFVNARFESGSLKGTCEFGKPSASAYFASVEGEGSVTL
jgi:hypothetical protein